MAILQTLLVGLVALLHFGFLVMESFLWRTPTGMKIFKMTPEQAEQTAVLAMNQGLYNGFLAAGLIWGLMTAKRDVQVFFLVCVVIAGLVGGITAKKTILFVQALPGVLALAAVLLNRPAGN